jgi:hypothetical protein
VEHPCQQCGTAVEDGRPFCPQCRAPQIHVEVAIPDPVVATGLNRVADEVSAETLQTAVPHYAQFQRPGAMNRRFAVRAALKAGVLGVFIGMIPLLGIVLTGALAVYLYRRESRFVLAAADGSRLGGAAGVVAFAINAILLTIRIFVFHAQQEYVEFLTRFAHTVGANAADPDFQAGIHGLLTPQGIAITFFFGLILAAVLAAVGGGLASLLQRTDKPRM